MFLFAAAVEGAQEKHAGPTHCSDVDSFESMPPAPFCEVPTCPLHGTLVLMHSFGASACMCAKDDDELHSMLLNFKRPWRRKDCSLEAEHWICMQKVPGAQALVPPGRLHRETLENHCWSAQTMMC